jgi:ketosteroid isomerase-like protein
MANTQTSTLMDTTETRAAFPDAFNGHDANALMDFMIKDCVIDAVGESQAYGRRFVGCGAARGVSERQHTGIRPYGGHVEAEGCDLFEFRDKQVALQRAFLNERPKQNF